MTRLLLIPLLVAIVALSSCVLKGNGATGKTPPTPAPATQTEAKPPMPQPPVSTPQTQVQLPPPQAVNPAALATIPPVREELPAPDTTPAAKTAPARKSSTTQNSNATRTDQPAQTAETPAPVQGPPAPPVTPPAEEQPRLQPVYSEEERRRAWAELERRKGEIEALLRGINQNRMSTDQKNVVDRIRSFISTADESAKRGDFRSAQALSDRALIFARELASGR